MTEQDKRNEVTHELTEAAERFLTEMLNGLSGAARAKVVEHTANGARLVVHIEAPPPHWSLHINLVGPGEKPEIVPLLAVIVPASQVAPPTVH